MDHRQKEFEALERVLADPSADPIRLSHEFFENITKGFAHRIGGGGFGEVYTGFVKNMKVAVKKLFGTNDFSDVQFEDELQCLIRVKHKNTVRCLGYCSDTKKELKPYNGKFVMAEERRKYICFEYAPNQSLHELLKDESCRHEWQTRYQLIMGICQGLQYLHNEERITHMDLKPANILLDADMVPKITDFGLSRRFSGAQSRKVTENIRATPGYVAPEYWTKGHISFKADIFSLGVIIKNLVKGSTDLSDFENWYKSLDLGPQWKRCIEIAQQCVDDDPQGRPTIDSVIEMLNVKENNVQLVSLVSGQSRTSSSLQQAISSISKSADGLQSLPVSAGTSSKQQQHEQINGVLRGPGEQSTEGKNFVPNLFDEAQSMSDLGPPTLVQQNEQITAIPKGSGETSSTEVASSCSVSKSTDNNMHYKVVSTEPLSSHHHHRQQQQIISVPKGPAEEITEGSNFIPNLLDEVLAMSNLGPPSLVQQNEQITTITKGPGETSSNEGLDEVQSISASGPGETSTETSKLLDVHPQELCFRFERNKLIRCPLTLTNRTEHYVGVWITLTYPDKQSGLHFPVMYGKESLEEDTACFEILGPHSTLAVPMTMKELPAPPMCDTGKFDVLMIVMRQKEHLQKLKASNMDDNFLKRAEELEGMVYNKVILKAAIRYQTSCQAVIANYKFMPTSTSFRDIKLITDVHPAKTWLLARQKGGCVSIWDYQTTQKMLKFVQVTKVSTRQRHPSREFRFPPNLAPNEEDRLVRGERSRAPPPTPRLSLPEDLYPQQEVVDPAVRGSERVVSRGVASKLDRGVDVAQAQLGHGGQEGDHDLLTAMESETGRGRGRSVAGEVDRLSEQGVLTTMSMGMGLSSLGGSVGVAGQPPGYRQGVGIHQLVTTAAMESGGNHGWAGGVPSPSGWGSGRVVEMAQPPRGGYTYGPGIISQVPTTTMVAAGAGYWRRGEGRRPRHGRYDDDAAARTQFIPAAARGSWRGAPRRAPTTTSHHPRRASSSHHRTFVPTTNGQCLDVRSAKFIDREQWLAIGDDDGCVHVYDYSTAATVVVKKVTEFTAHGGGIVDLLSVHPTRQLLLTAYSFEGTVKLWDWGQNWNCTRTFNVRNTKLLRLSWNPSDTNVFATLSHCNTLKLWKTDSSDPSTTMEGVNRADHLCSGSQRHLMVTTSHLETNDKKSAIIWDLQTKNDVHRLGLSGCDVYDVACHPTLPILATSHSDGSIVCLWNTMNYRLETILQLPESHIPGLIFITSTENVTRLVTQCQGGISTVEIKMPTSTWTGIHNGGEN